MTDGGEKRVVASATTNHYAPPVPRTTGPYQVSMSGLQRPELHQLRERVVDEVVHAVLVRRPTSELEQLAGLVAAIDERIARPSVQRRQRIAAER